MSTQKTIACLGSGSGKEGDAQYDAMVEVGRLLAQRRCTVITGGFGGAGMEAPAKGATEASGIAVGYTMLGKPGNPYLSRAIDCGTYKSIEIPAPECQYGFRLGSLLTADGFIISAYGGPGTMVELMAIINLNTKMWKEKPKRFTILNLHPFAGTAWNNNMCEKLFEWEVFPREVASSYITSSAPQQAVDWVCQ